jgi:hypothetical protein
MEIFVCAALNLWKERNDHIFKSQVVSLDRSRVRLHGDLQLHTYRIKPCLVQPLPDWIASCFT